MDMGDIIKPCFAIGGVVIVYTVYMTCGPGGDGIIFASVIAAIAGLGGFILRDIISRGQIRKFKKNNTPEGGEWK